jgi:hypothetical protein
VLGPNDAQKKKKEGRKKNKASLSPFLFFLPYWVIYPLGHGTRFLCLGQRVEITHL